MITGADAITQMRKLDDLIESMREAINEWADEDAETFVHQLETWRDEVTKGGGIRPINSYAEVA